MIDQILTRIAAQYSLRRLSGRYAGPCPKCGGSATSDKFVIKDDGGYKCYACTDMHGDIITWLREMEQMSCPEAHEAAGKECRRTSCGVFSTCRMGDGSGRRTAPTAKGPRSLTLPPASHKTELPLISATEPDKLWADWADELVASAHSAIAGQPAVIHWLNFRGIRPAMVSRFQLGWLAHDRKIERASVGLPLRADGKTTLWIPSGLLIPIFDDQGNIHRLRVRRTKEAMARFLPDLKYVWLEGSGNCPLVIRPQGESRGVVVVEAELDAYACATAHDQVTVISIGSVAAGLPAPLRQELESAPVILVALDADPAKDGKAGAGQAAVANWIRLYRQAKFWPVPTAKDPGEYVEAGGNLRSWIEAGLFPLQIQADPAAVAADSLPVSADPAADHDFRLSPERPLQGVGGSEELTNDELRVTNEEPGAGDEDVLDYRIITLSDGREICVTDHEPTWHRLTMAGKVVFSQNELERLKVACSTMSAPEAAAAALLAVDVKEAFPAAYIRHGRVQEVQ